MRLKDQIKLIKAALKRHELYSDVEIHFMKKQLNEVKQELKLKKLRRNKGFNNEFSETDNRNTRSREDDGLRSTSEQPKQSGEP